MYHYLNAPVRADLFLAEFGLYRSYRFVVKDESTDVTWSAFRLCAPIALPNIDHVALRPDAITGYGPGP